MRAGEEGRVWVHAAGYRMVGEKKNKRIEAAAERSTDVSYVPSMFVRWVDPSVILRWVERFSGNNRFSILSFLYSIDR